MTLFQNKFRVESARLKDWDYSNDGVYFVTICTYKHINYFGKIKGSEVKLNNIGRIVSNEWLRTKAIRNDIVIDEFIIMPNHIHGILIIQNEDKSSTKKSNISNIIKGFKSAVSKKVFETGFKSFKWQSRFYDHIIGSEKSLGKIREYIVNNPLKWKIDEYNKKEEKLFLEKIKN